MTVAPITPRRVWYSWIPKSWYAQEGGGVPDQRNDHRAYRDRDRDRETDLDDTRSYRRRYEDLPPSSSPKVQIPAGAVLTLVIYLIGQLIGGVWWAATQQSNLQHEIVDRAKEETKLWNEINTYRVEVNALRIEIARLTSANPRRQTNGSRNEED